MAGATGYTWSVAGGTITAGQNTNSVTVNWTATGSHTLAVLASNSCGNSAAKNLTINVSVPTAIVDPDDEFRIRVLPNPSRGEFFLQAKNIINKEVKIQVMNMTGQIVVNEKIRVRANDFFHRMDLRAMADGLYQIVISVDKKLYLRKMLKVE